LCEDRRNSIKRKIIADPNSSWKKISKETGKKTSTVPSEVKKLANEATDTKLPKSLEPKESLNCPIPRRKKSTLDSSDKKDSLKSESKVSTNQKSTHAPDVIDFDKRRKKSTLDSSDKKDSLKSESKVSTHKKSTHAPDVNDFDKETETMNEKAAIHCNKNFYYAKDGCLPPPDYISIPKKAASYFTESMPHETDTLVFYVTDNEGEGNCFYQAICDSVAFVKEYPEYKNNHHLLRKNLTEHVRKFPDLARKLFDAFLGIDEITEWAGELLYELVKKNSSRFSGDKFFR
jgi:hypothetical protein